jgi:hypothetical protein
MPDATSSITRRLDEARKLWMAEAARLGIPAHLASMAFHGVLAQAAFEMLSNPPKPADADDMLPTQPQEG